MKRNLAEDRRAAQPSAVASPPGEGASTATGSAPAAVAPRQVPMCMRGEGRRDEIETRGTQGVATAQSCHGHPPSGPNTEAANRLLGIGGTCGQMPTIKADKRGEGQAVCTDKCLCHQLRTR
jgi:hypothetical protein